MNRRINLNQALKGIALGAVAGAIGTIAMDVLWYVRYRRGGGQESALAWEFGGVSGWDDVGAPGQVGQKTLELVFGDTPPDSWAGPTQNAVHWLTGTGWGAAYGLAGSICSQRSPLSGPVLGLAAWATSYVVLPPMGIYKPMWEYDAKTLWKDLSAHLVFGSVTGGAMSVLAPSSTDVATQK